MLNQKGVAHIILILTLLIGIVATVFLVGKQQIFKPKATASNVEFLENSCTKIQDNTKVLTCANPKFKLISPLETNSITEGPGFVKVAYAQSTKAIGGVGYSCEKKDGDSSKIYHQKCNVVILGVNLCDLKIIPGTHYDLIQESCEIGLVCQESTTDLFNTIAKCVPSEDNAPIILRNLSPVVPIDFQPTSDFNPILPTPTPIPSLPTPTARALPSPSASQPAAAASPTSPTATPSPIAATPTPTSSSPSPVVSPSTSGNTDVGTTNPPVRTTAKYRYAESPAKLETAEWSTYTPGGVIVDDFSFSNTPGQKFIYAQFQDNLGQAIKSSNGQNFVIGQIELKAPAPVSTPTPTPVPTATPTSTPTPRPTPTPTPVSVSSCGITDLSQWKNCSHTGLKATFTLSQLAQLDKEALEQFSNGDLLSIGDATGDRKAFLSEFRCERIIKFSKEIQDFVGTCPQ